MKELLGILCAAVSVLAACVAVDAMNRCADAEEKKSKKAKKEETPTEDFGCSECCEDCYGFDDIEIDVVDLDGDDDVLQTDDKEEVIKEDKEENTTED